MAPLTVVQLLPALNSGGVERGTLEVAAELVKRGHRAIVISEGGSWVEPLKASGAHHIPWPIGKKSFAALRWIPRLRQFYQAQGVDIIHARSRLPAWLGYAAWRTLPANNRPRFITTAHGLYSPGRYSAIMGAGEKVIAVSETVKTHLMQHWHLPESRLQVIYRGIEPQQYPYGYQPSPAWQMQWYQAYPQVAQKIVMTLPGRLTRRKGHADFLTLIQTLKNHGLDTVWGIIAGGADLKHQAYQQELQREIHQRQLPVIITGERQDIKEIMASSRLVFSLSTQPESFGRTVLEALSLGVPVIGYAQGGVAEILAALYPQGAIPVGDIAALAQRVRAFLQHPAPPVPQTHPFTLQKMLAQTMALYERLAA